MAADVLGGRVDDDVGTQRDRAAVERRGPGVVRDGHRAVRAGDGGQGGNVLDLESVRARRFDEQHPGGRPHQCGDPGAGARVVERGGNAEARQGAGAEAARGPVGRVGNEDVVALADEGHDGAGACAQPRGQRPAAVAALEFAHRLEEGAVRRRAVHAVGHGAGVVPDRRAAHALAQVGGIGVQHGRAALQRRVDEFLAHAAGATGQVDQTGAGLHGRGRGRTSAGRRQTAAREAENVDTAGDCITGWRRPRAPAAVA